MGVGAAVEAAVNVYVNHGGACGSFYDTGGAQMATAGVAAVAAALFAIRLPPVRY